LILRGRKEERRTASGKAVPYIVLPWEMRSRGVVCLKFSGYTRRMKMAGPIYKFWMVRFTEAWYQLSEEEQGDHLTKVGKALEEVGGKSIVTCGSAWSTEQWQFFGVEEFPDIEANQKLTDLLMELNHYRYIESVSVLGTGLEPS
jgi:hypothetical protein